MTELKSITKKGLEQLGKDLSIKKYYSKSRAVLTKEISNKIKDENLKIDFNKYPHYDEQVEKKESSSVLRVPRSPRRSIRVAHGRR